MKTRTSKTPECAAFPILRLNAGAQITHVGQVQRLSLGALITIPPEKNFSYCANMLKIGQRQKDILESYNFCVIYKNHHLISLMPCEPA